MWVDTHCHLQYEGMSLDFVQEAHDAEVEKIICVGTDVAESQKAIEIAQANENVWATVGLHPHDSKNGLDGFEELLTQDKVVAVGECGLDFYYDHSPRDTQREVFAKQIGFANQHDLALIIHTRNAWDETFDILKAEGVPKRTVFHCFTGGIDEAKRCIEVGGFISFSGIITFKKADDVREAAQWCPLEKLLVETDAPFLSPEPHRGDTNRPKWVKLVGDRIARIKELDITAVEKASSENSFQVFALK